MSSNDSGQNPWGKRPQHDPTDLAALFKRLYNKYASSNGSNANSGNNGGFLNSGILMLGAAVIVVIWVIAGIFVVSPQQEAVILRFGKYIKTVGAGPHWIPRGIETKQTVNVTEQNTFKYSAQMLTRDENIVSVSLAVQYRIDNPKEYLFNVNDPDLTIQQATSSALRQVVGGMNLDEVITTGRQTLSDEVKEQLVTTLNLYDPGLFVADITLQQALPPEEVTHAFDDAIKAREDEVTYENQAQAYARKVESQAQGAIARLTQEAKAYKSQVVLQAKGTTSRYLALLGPYQAAPKVTSERLYLDAITNVLSKTSNVFVDNDGSNGTSVFYLPLEELLKQHAKSISTKGMPSSDGLVSSGSTTITAANQNSFNNPKYPFLSEVSEGGNS